MQLASAIQARRVQLLQTIEQVAEFSGLKPDLWSELEAGFIPPLDNTLWIWWTLAGTLQVSVSKLFNLASVDLARNEMLAKKEKAA
jgi:transcriptional regulator with XRE-family HTH domain